MAKGRKPHDGNGAGGRRRAAGSDEGSLCSSDGEESWHSTQDSKRGSGSYDECRLGSASDPEIGAVPELRRESSESDFCSDVDFENGVPEIKVHLGKAEKDCRICHLSLESVNQESGIPIELGCSCKDDLAAAHKQCAEAWFKIKGNKTCEICGTTARNVVTSTEAEMIAQLSEASNAAVTPQSETRSFWRGHRFLNFLLACIVFAFVISWLLHFNVPP